MHAIKKCNSCAYLYTRVWGVVKHEPVEPGNAPRISIGHREVVCQNSCKTRLQISKLWAGQDFALRSCCDLDLQGSDQNVARDTLS